MDADTPTPVWANAQHESSDFSPIETPLKSLLSSSRDAAQIAASSGEANTVVDGFIKAIKEHGREMGIEMVPLFQAQCTSSK